MYSNSWPGKSIKYMKFLVFYTNVQCTLNTLMKMTVGTATISYFKETSGSDSASTYTCANKTLAV